MMLTRKFFARDALVVARELLGKVIRVRYGKIWLSAMITEAEAYYIHDKASHASLGYTKKREALFMPPGTIYMYYSRGGDSLNVSCLGEGNAVLIKAAYPYTKRLSERAVQKMLNAMQKLCATTFFGKTKRESKLQLQHQQRPLKKLCSGQALLCRSLGLTVKKWDQKQFDKVKFYIDDVGYHPKKIIKTKRCGIPQGRDEHLPYRFVMPFAK